MVLHLARSPEDHKRQRAVVRSGGSYAKPAAVMLEPAAEAGSCVAIMAQSCGRGDSARASLKRAPARRACGCGEPVFARAPLRVPLARGR